MPACLHCGTPLAPDARHCPRCGVTLSPGGLATLPGDGYHAGPPTDDAMIGRSVIGQFVVRAKLGVGGMGAVYVADQPAIGRSAAIKVIHPWLSKDPNIAAAFENEARAAARLQNPHIVSIYNYGRLTDGTLFLAMEYLEGTTLDALLRTQGRLEPSRAVAIATQVCEALTEAHRKGVIHRDLKPSNLMVLQRGRAPSFIKVLDFGLAGLDGQQLGGAHLAGTPPYMSPEQLARGAVDARSDVYALACILYEILSGRPPFAGSGAEAMARLHAEQGPPPLSQAAAGVRIPPALEACVMRALAGDPYHRPQTAASFADELWASTMTTVDSSHIPAPAVHAPLPSQRTVRRAVLAGIGMLAIVFGLGVWAMTRSPPAQESGLAVTLTARTDVASEPSPNLAATRGALVSQTRGRLESELQRAAVLYGVPAEDTDAALDGVERSSQSPPFGLSADQYVRTLLADLILTWRALPRSTDGAGRSLDELEALFLRMDSVHSLQERRLMLNTLKTHAQPTPDQQASLRGTLVAWIDVHGRPAEESDDDDDDIQIDDGG